MKLAPLCWTTAVLIIATQPAFAEPVVTGKRPLIDDGSLTRVVKFQDLDITTATGEKVLMGRVRRAVREVCAPASDIMIRVSCENFAWNGARPKVALALEQARTNRSLASATLATLTISAPH